MLQMRESQINKRNYATLICIAHPHTNSTHTCTLATPPHPPPFVWPTFAVASPISPVGTCEAFEA